MPKRQISRRIASKTEEPEEVYYPPESERLSLSSYKKTAIGFLSLAILLLTAIAYVSFARATVTVMPRITENEAEVTAGVRSDPAEGEVAGEIRTIILEGERIEAVTGETREMPANAVGTVKIINNSSRPMLLVATTRLLSKDGVLFRLKKAVTVSAKSSSAAEVYADKPGKEGNIEPTTFTIPGLSQELQKQIYATSEAAMTGGVVMRAGVGQEDVNRAAEEVAKQIMENGSNEIRKMWESGLGNAEIYQKKILAVESDPPIGSDARSFKVKARVQITGIRYDREKLYSLAEAKLKEKSGADVSLVSTDADNFVVEVVKVDSETKVASLKAKLKGNFSITEKSKVLDPDQLVGLTRSSAESYLRGFHSVESVEIKISPFWLRRLPNLKDRINIKVITK